MRRGLEPTAIRPTPPYRITPHLERHCLSGEPMPCTYDRGSRRWSALVGLGDGDRPLVVSIRGEGQNPLLQMYTEDDLGHDLRARAAALASWAFSTDVDYMGFMGRAAGTPIQGLAWRGFGLRPARALSVYEALLMALVWGQGKSAAALAALVKSTGRSIALRGERFYGPPDHEKVLALGVEGLRSLGFPRQRAEAVVEVAAAHGSGALPTLDDASQNPRKAARAFAEIKGVGRSAAETAASLVSRRPWGGVSPEAASRALSEGPGAGYGARDIEDLLGDYVGLAYYLAVEI